MQPAPFCDKTITKSAAQGSFGIHQLSPPKSCSAQHVEHAHMFAAPESSTPTGVTCLDRSVLGQKGESGR